MTIAYTPDLMTQATQSTKNIGWLQEYLALWNLLQKTCRRIQNEQAKQATYDEVAFEALSELMTLAQSKISQLDDAYTRQYAKHLMLMDRILNQEENS